MLSASWSDVAAALRGKRVAIVGSAPSVMLNKPGVIDGYDVVMRINNYKLRPATGFRCDVHYSFYGTSITKHPVDLKRDGVKLCLCKLPNSKPLESAWHEERRKFEGIDYRYIYKNREAWWFCPVFVPDDERFLAKFELLGKHQPTTGFAGILDVVEAEPAEVFLTGFDFFTSAVHNVDERWVHKNTDDPICHRPDLEASWIKAHAGRFVFDERLKQMLS